MNKDVTYYPKKDIEKSLDSLETPFFIYEEKKIRENCRQLKKSFEENFENFWPLYAVKANPNPEILKIIYDEGFDMDVSSPSEVWISKKISKRSPRGMFTGNYNSPEELKDAKESGFILNLDDESMIKHLEKIGIPETVSFRINPGIGKAGIESNVLAGPNAKFGMPHEKAPEAYKKLKELGVKRFGIHMMTGSNVLDKNYFSEIVEKLFDIIIEIKEKAGVDIEMMNIGGGFGVPYRPEEPSLDIASTAKNIKGAFNKKCGDGKIQEPTLLVEPGRYITANAGWLVSRVINIKDGYKKFVGVDAGMNDMPRPAIYGAYHHISILDKNGDKEEVSIVGPLCENNDQFAKNRNLPKIEEGDVIIIHNCGGHAYSMGHNYNGRTRHAEYLIRENGSIEMIRRKETVEDLFRTTNLPN